MRSAGLAHTRLKSFQIFGILRSQEAICKRDAADAELCVKNSSHISELFSQCRHILLEMAGASFPSRKSKVAYNNQNYTILTSLKFNYCIRYYTKTILK